MTATPVDFAERVRRLNDQSNKRRPLDDVQEKETDVRATIATKMANLGLENAAETWHTPTGEPFVTTVVDGIRRHYPINGAEYPKYLQRLNYLEYGTAPAADAVRAALNVIAGEAAYAGTEHPVYSRIAHHEDEIWIDLGDDSWRAVRISPTLLPRDWEVVDSTTVPVRFRRSSSTLPLPIPEEGGSLETLRSVYPNIGDDDWLLAIGWIMGCFQQHGGRAFLELLGGQGCGKSTLGRYLISLVDPNEASLRSMPKSEHDLLISVQGRIAAGFDNLSVIPPAMADAFCRISTGAGISNRALYTNAEDFILKAQLSLVWTAIEPQAIHRADLQDRTLTIRLEGISELARRSEREILASEEVMRPQHLGAIYHAVAKALSRQDEIQAKRLPRLADFAIWTEAAAPAFNWNAGEFVNVLESRRTIASALAVEAAAIGPLLVEFMATRCSWEGTATELLVELKHLADDDIRRSGSFPKNATLLSGQLRRLVEPLRAVGVGVDFDRSAGNRSIHLCLSDDRPGRCTAPDPGPDAARDQAAQDPDEC